MGCFNSSPKGDKGDSTKKKTDPKADKKEAGKDSAKAANSKPTKKDSAKDTVRDKESIPAPSKRSSAVQKSGEGGAEVMHKLGDGLLEGAMFGVGVHVGREGNVDLTGRNLDFLGNSLIKMINEDGLGRSAKSLTLTNNALYTIGKEIILLKNLEEIEMNSNRFTHLPEALTLLKKLRRIDVSNNPITPVGFGVLLRLDTLTSLTVKDCQLKQVPDTILSMGPNLVELDLSDNPDIKINESNFGKLKIEVLKIANTGLRGQNLPGGVKVVRTIKSLDISNNAFTFDEDNDNFFGRYMPDTLKELQIRKLGLTSVPQVIARLKLLTSLDLSENPIETLDVLAGRLVKRMSKLSSGGSSTNLEGKGAQVTERNTSSYKDNDPLTANKEDDGLSDDKASNSSRVSISKVSKIGMISSVAQTLPLKKLLLRECGLRTVPKYFHKMTNLEELDLSDNYYLDDPNMTLFSLQKLKKLNITGCPFADNPATARNEWFDIAKLSMLRDLKWERWKVAHNMSPYRTKIPIEICGMQLSSINEVALRKNLFTGNTITTISNLLRDGYFKVDLSVDENVVFSHFEAIKLFKNFKKFFFPDDSTVKHPAPKGTKAEPVVQGNDLGQLHLKIAISRYIFFLAVQAANYDAVIIPPPDVMIIHYAQLTIAPAKYRIDCEAICGRILNCNYRNYFIEEKKNANAAKGTVAASKKIWNLMVRSAQSNLQWLRYDFWDRRTKGTKTTAPQSLLLSLPTDTGGATVDEVLANTNELRQMDSAHDLSNVLDPAISSHFDDQATEVFAESLVSFFRINEHLLQYEGALVNISLDWNRYVQYLALYALRVSAHRVDSMVFEPNYESDLFAPQIPCRVPSLLGPHYDLLNNESFGDPSKYLPQPAPSFLSEPGSDGTASTAPKRSVSVIKKEKQRREAMEGMSVNPVPTIGITLLLFAHRTFHVKYFQTLTLLGIEDQDIHWESSDSAIKATESAWRSLFDEAYVGALEKGETFVCEDGPYNPILPNAAFKATSPEKMHTFVKDATPSKGILSGPKDGKKPKRSVTLCCGDTEHGVF